MSGYSRPQKFIREVTGVASLEEAEKLRSQPFWLIVHEDAAPRIHVMVRALVAIAIRSTSGTIHIRTDGSDPFSARVGNLAEMEAGKYGCLDRLSVGPRRADEQIGPGIGIGIAIPGLITVDAAGMYATVNRVFPKSAATPHASAACFSAAIGFAKYFNSAILGRSKSAQESWVFSLADFRQDEPTDLDLQKPVPATDLRKAHLLGAGAIGSAFCYSISLSSDGADLEIVDKERYDEPNQETTFFINKGVAARNQPKAIVLADFARREGLLITPHGMKALAEDDEYLAHECDVFICAVDNPETRRILDRVNSRVLLNAGLGGTRLDAGHVLVSVHGHDTEALSRLYPATSDGIVAAEGPAPREIKDDCSRVAYNSVSLAAPFMALASGALLHALCHGLAHNAPPISYLKLDLLAWQQSIIRKLYGQNEIRNTKE